MKAVAQVAVAAFFDILKEGWPDVIAGIMRGMAVVFFKAYGVISFHGGRFFQNFPGGYGIGQVMPVFCGVEAVVSDDDVFY